MSDLITRLEAATGPDRELDAAIFTAVYHDKVPSPIVESGYGWRYDKGHWWLATGEDARTPPKCVFPPRFTASIDAALTLVPEGWRWHSYHWRRKDEPKIMSLVTNEPHVGIAHGKAATPALAICIAALRARGEP